MPRLLRILLVVAALFVVAGVWIWRALDAPRFEVPERRALVLRDVTVVEPARSRTQHVDLAIRGGQIVSLTPSRKEAAEGHDREFAGRHALPGLIDLHVHYPPAAARGNQALWSLLLLAHGVTTARETGSIDGTSLDHREALRRGETLGPRLFSCGAMLDGEPASFPSNRTVRTPEEARAAVADLDARGVDCIKVYNMLSRPAFEAIREEARARDLPLIGHMPHDVAFENSGIAELQHFTGAVPVDRDKVGLLDFRYEDWQAMDAERIAHVIRVARSEGLAFTPTLANVRQRQLLAAPRTAEDDESDTGLRHLPRFWWPAWQLLWDGFDGPAALALQTDFHRRIGELTAEAFRAGVTVRIGTDTLMPFVAPGSSAWEELREFVRFGVPLEASWAIATRGGGEALGVPGLGTLAPGAPADLLIFRDDPTRDLAALGTLEAVIADGRLHRRADLEAALARADAHFRGPLYETVMNAVAAVARGTFARE
jgi:imidazolonepropionase-like amidohydrolase